MDCGLFMWTYFRVQAKEIGSVRREALLIVMAESQENKQNIRCLLMIRLETGKLNFVCIPLAKISQAKPQVKEWLLLCVLCIG